MYHSAPELVRRLLLAGLLLAGLQQLAGASLIKAKAYLAPVLMERAWSQSLATGGAPVKPWAWADTWPVARLRIPEQGIEQLVLAGDSGNALAFGPGHSNASSALGGQGLAVIGGHRDTHFRFLPQLRNGSRVSLQLADGAERDYWVVAMEVIDSRLRKPRQELGEETLQLVTCYPFDSLDAGGPLRYVVTARPVYQL